MDEVPQPLSVPRAPGPASHYTHSWPRCGSPAQRSSGRANAQFEWQVLHLMNSFHSWLHWGSGLKDYGLKQLTFLTSFTRKLEVNWKDQSETVTGCGPWSGQCCRGAVGSMSHPQGHSGATGTQRLQRNGLWCLGVPNPMCGHGTWGPAPLCSSHFSLCHKDSADGTGVLKPSEEKPGTPERNLINVI